jgi:hypothetical protein
MCADGHGIAMVQGPQGWRQLATSATSSLTRSSTSITSAIMANAYQLAQSQSLRVYVRTPTRHIEARLVTASFREILVAGTEGSRKMSLFIKSVLKVGGALLCYLPGGAVTSSSTRGRKRYSSDCKCSTPSLCTRWVLTRLE